MSETITGMESECINSTKAPNPFADKHFDYVNSHSIEVSSKHSIKYKVQKSHRKYARY